MKFTPIMIDPIGHIPGSNAAFGARGPFGNARQGSSLFKPKMAVPGAQLAHSFQPTYLNGVSPITESPLLKKSPFDPSNFPFLGWR